jgi:ABC-type uncharacterized transport system substrate-binding protein
LAWDEALRAASALGVQLVSLDVRQPDDAARVYGDMAALDAVLNEARDQVDALLAITDGNIGAPKFYWERTISSGLPTMFEAGDAVRAGGLMAVGNDIPDTYRRVAVYIDKILRGAWPGDLPVEQPTRYQVVVNATAARSLGLVLPPSLVLQVTEWVQ